MKLIVVLLTLIMVGCATTQQSHEPPYQWQTIEGMKEARSCVSQCPTANSCSIAYLEYCISSARQMDMMYAEMKKAP